MKKFLLAVATVSLALLSLSLDAGWRDKSGAYAYQNHTPRQFKQPDMFHNKQATSFVSKKQIRHYLKTQKQKTESSAPEQVTRWEPRFCIKDPAVVCLMVFLLLSAMTRAYEVVHCHPKHAVQLPSAREIARRIGAVGFKRFAYMSDLPELLGNKKMNGCDVWGKFRKAEMSYVKKFESSPVHSLQMGYCEWLALLYVPGDIIIPAVFGRARKPLQERSVARFVHDHDIVCPGLKRTGQY